MSRTAIYIIVTAIVLFAGLIFWLMNLNADPPMYYSGIGQGLTTDPAHYVYHARNKVLFGEYDLFDDPRWTVFQHSLVSLSAYLIYNVTEISYEYSNTIGVLLSLMGLLFFIFGLYDKKRSWQILLFALLYLTNMTLFVYGRVPFLENALIFYTGLLYFIHSRFNDKLWAVVLSGVIIALATLTGKVFGLLLLPAIGLSLFFTTDKKRFVPVVWLGGSFIVSFIIIAFLLYGSNIGYAFGYVSEQGAGLRGFPDGLKSPWGFFEHLLNFGAENRLFRINYDLIMYLTIAIVILGQRMRSGMKLKALGSSILFPLFLIGFGILTLMPLNYSPLRYALFLIPILLVLFVQALPLLSHRENKSGNSRLSFVLYMIAFWFLLFDTTLVLFYDNDFPLRTLCWTTLPFAAILAYLFYKFQPLKKLTSRSLRISIITVVIVGGVSINGYGFYGTNKGIQNYTISEASADLGQILGKNAVLTGASAPVLSINNHLQVYIHQFTLLEQPQDLFTSHPITHLAVTAEERALAMQFYPELALCKPVVSYWLRDVEVVIYYIGEAYTNSRTETYQPTQYERAVRYEYNGFSDSAFSSIEIFTRENPGSKSGQYLKAQLLLKAGQFEESIRIINMLVARFPTDSRMLIEGARMVQFMSIHLNNQSLLQLAQKYYERGVEVNPYRYQYARQVFQQVENQFQKR